MKNGIFRRDFGFSATAVEGPVGRSDVQGKVVEHGRQRIGHEQSQRVVDVRRQTFDGLVQQEQLRATRAEGREPVAEHQTQESDMTTTMRGRLVPSDRQQLTFSTAGDTKTAYDVLTRRTR